MEFDSSWRFWVIFLRPQIAGDSVSSDEAIGWARGLDNRMRSDGVGKCRIPGEKKKARIHAVIRNWRPRPRKLYAVTVLFSRVSFSNIKISVQRQKI